MAAETTTDKKKEPADKTLSTPTLPARGTTAGFSDADWTALETLVAEPPAFIDHADLHRRGAEKALYGHVPQLVGPNAARFPTPERIIGPEGGGSAIPTLSHQQERQLFLRLNYSRMKIGAIVERFRGKRLSATAARDLLAWYHWSLAFRAEIVELNMPLVLAMAKRTRLNSLDFNEMISEGNMALLRSVDKFDCGRGFKFSTYSCRAILKSFSRVAMRASRYRGRFPTEFDPALEVDDTVDRKRANVVEDCLDELKDILLRNQADLSEVERTVILERFALDGSQSAQAGPRTLEEVGLIIGVTKERVRQIQNKALRKLRVALESGYLAA